MHLQLRHNQSVINTLLPHKLIMCADLGNPVLIKHNNPVGLSQGGQTVGDCKGCPPLGKSVQRLLNLVLGFGIQTACRLVKYQQPRVMQDCPCNRNALALAARKIISPLPYISIVTIRKLVIKSCAFAIFAAFITSSRVASGFA